MSQVETTAVVEQKRGEAVYVPFGESEPIKLTLGLVRSHIAVKTKRGAEPTDSDLIRFIMLCKARELNPWVGDAYLVGYDGQDGPRFSLITGVQALLKRAEANPNFDGLESGVVVLGKDQQSIERRGNIVYPGENLYGGWARCYRKDVCHPFYDALKLSTFDTGRSQWKKDPAGMIDKCAISSVLRLAFPTQLSGIYVEQERGLLEREVSNGRQSRQPGVKPSWLNELPSKDESEQVQPGPEQAETEPAEEGVDEPSPDDAVQESPPDDVDQSEPVETADKMSITAFVKALENCDTGEKVEALRDMLMSDDRYSAAEHGEIARRCVKRIEELAEKG